MIECPKLNQEFNLLNAKLNKKYKIKYIKNDIDKKYKRRLVELGFLPNEEIEVQKKSTFKKTFLVSVRGVCFLLRKEIATLIVVGEL